MSDDEVSGTICDNSTNSASTKTNKTTNNNTNNDCVSANKTLSDNDTIYSSSQDTRTSKNVSNQNNAVSRHVKEIVRDKEMMNGKELVNTNLDQLTDDVLNLPREYRLIRLAGDCTISSNTKRKKDTTNLNESVAKVNVPTLPEFSTEIYVDPNDMESKLGDEITVSQNYKQ